MTFRERVARALYERWCQEEAKDKPNWTPPPFEDVASCFLGPGSHRLRPRRPLRVTSPESGHEN